MGNTSDDLWCMAAGARGRGLPHVGPLISAFSFNEPHLSPRSTGVKSQRDNVTIVKQAENEQSCSFDDMHSDQREEPIKEPEKNQ